MGIAASRWSALGLVLAATFAGACVTTTTCERGASRGSDGRCHVDGPLDAGPPDAEPPDTGVPDAELPDAGSPDAQPDATMDAASDAAADASMDASMDADMDAGRPCDLPDGGPPRAPVDGCTPAVLDEGCEADVLFDYADAIRDCPDGGECFQRASRASLWVEPDCYREYDADEPRFLSDRSLYVEGERTNIINSQNLGSGRTQHTFAANTWWTTPETDDWDNAITTPGPTIFDDAWSVRLANQRRLHIPAPVSQPGTVSYSMFVRGLGLSARYELASGEAVLAASVPVSWERRAATVDLPGGFIFNFGTDEEGLQVFDLRGIQVEEATFPSQYIPPIAEGVRPTRAADVLEFPIEMLPAEMLEGDWEILVQPAFGSAGWQGIATIIDATTPSPIFLPAAVFLIAGPAGVFLGDLINVGGATPTPSWLAGDILRMRFIRSEVRIECANLTTGVTVSATTPDNRLPTETPFRIGDSKTNNAPFFGRIGRPRRMR